MSIEKDLSVIAEQEARLVFPSFDAERALALGMRLRQMASARQAPVVIDISLISMPLFFTALSGATPDNPHWVRRKRACVFRFFRSSYGVGLSLKLKGSTLAETFGLPDADFAAHGGSFPIHVEGAGCVGAVTVSGLPQREDHALVVAALADELGLDPTSLALSG
ncbi:hypothetical protein BJF93_20535 [Xaviernesmea oryzae]|uniref:UPF0303 protein BJF93_20535 n=1 Tax=Xaviernesmea oryzae TaxID=464029 RepID=A0A1Q9AVV7_9HYPH|nr:heme-degrading domain-containing protein [Xaviernesmea oryzae]OLP59601.1 hypothetical protein BJF93_20535 [Xaviernesmea oryzae]SEM12464.1 Uncharacterized protein, UPF0303 family [Xaviernesmea oryzae]